MKDVKGIDIPTPFQRMKYKEAMDRFGSDKPDVRFGLELKQLTDVLEGCDFKVFAEDSSNRQTSKSVSTSKVQQTNTLVKTWMS